MTASRLDETLALIEAGFLSQAAVVFSFAVEEFGKAMLLRTAYNTGDDPVVVNGFDDHRVKIAEAYKMIPAKFLLLKSGFFDPDFFDPTFFETGTPVDFKARLEGLYVDWNGSWHHGVDIEADSLRKSINGVRSILTGALAAWPP